MDWTVTIRAAALDLSPLIVEKEIDFEITASPCWVRGHDWMLRELVRNLLHNAVRHTPRLGHLEIRVDHDTKFGQLRIRDSGPGLEEGLWSHLFEPFNAGKAHAGTGLGLTIAREVVVALGGKIHLNNRLHDGQVCGLDAVVQLPGVAAPAAQA
jgi:two-component system sensor histidine kinase TctE